MRFFYIPVLALMLSAHAFGGAVQLETSSPQEVTFVVSFDAPTWREESHQGAVYRFPHWGDLSTAAEIGEPEVPFQTINVAVPFQGEVHLQYTTAAGGTQAKVRFAPAPGPVRDHRDSYPRPAPGDLDRAPREEGGGYASGPAVSQVEILEIETQRGVRVARVRVSPVSWAPVSGGLTWASRISVTLRFSGLGNDSKVFPGGDSAFEVLWQTGVINPESVPRFRQDSDDVLRSPGSPAQSIPPNWFNSADTWIKVKVVENGLYKIMGSDLESEGVDLGALDPTQIRLFSGPLLEDFRWKELVLSNRTEWILKWLHVSETTGFTTGFGEAVNPVDGRPGMEEVALSLDLGGDGSLDSGDAVYFYGLGPDNWLSRYGEDSPEFYESTYASATVYWLGINTQFPWPASRMEEVPAVPTGTNLAESQRVRLHFETNRVHDPSMRTKGIRWERYFWRRLTPSVGMVEDLILPELVPGSLMDARIRLWGANFPIGSGDARQHHARVNVNGVVATLSWLGAYDHLDTVFASIPGAASTRLEIEVVDFPGDPFRTDIIHLAWVEVTYDRMLDAQESPLEFEYGNTGDGVAITNLPEGAVWVLDVTDFRNPVRLLGGEQGTQVSVAPGGSSGVLFATGENAIKQPASIEMDSRPARWLRDSSQPLDYIILTHERFLDEAERLAAHRREHLGGITENRPARVEVVSISDVYDEFSWGMPDPMAIRYFLEYAWRYYGAPQDDRLAYCLLLGDTTYDPRDFEGYGVENLMPTWMYNFGPQQYLSFGNIQYVSDDFLARFDGWTDGFTELATGRISVATRDQARLVVLDKIIGNEINPNRGPWRTKAILIADDVCQGLSPDYGLLGRHMEQTEGIDGVIPAAFDRHKLYLFEYGEECLFPTKPDAKRDLLESWNEGAWLVNYIGHGASVVLADERVLDLEDIPGIANVGRLSLFSAFSCSVGKFANPALQGIGETVIKGSQGAASAAVVATYLTPSGGNFTLNKEFIEKLFPGETADPAPVGAALWMAKSTTNASVGERYLLMGDPAARLNIPESMLQLTGVSSIHRGRKEELVVTTETAGISGLLDVIVQDARERKALDKNGTPIPNLPMGFLRDPSTLFRGRSELDVSGSTGVQYVTPVTLREGDDGRVRAYAWNDDWDGLGTLTPLESGGQSESPSDSLGPQTTVDLTGSVLFPGQEVTLTLEDPAGIDISQLFEFRGILVRWRDLKGAELARLNVTDTFRYELGSYTKGSASFVVPEVEAGSYELAISSFDNYANKGELVLVLGVGEPGAPPQLSDVYAFPNPLKSSTQVVFTLDRPGEVEFLIYSIRGRKVLEERMPVGAGRNSWTWDARDELGDAVANGVYLLQVVLRDSSGNSVTRHLERLAVYR